MDRTFWRALLMGSIVAGLLLGGSFGMTPQMAMAEDEGEDEGEGEDEAPESEGIEWVEGWEAGRAQAAKDGKLMFVYFGRHAPR